MKYTSAKGSTNCENCANYIFDDIEQYYFCDCSLDEDETERFLRGDKFNCPYYSPGDEYRIVRKQN